VVMSGHGGSALHDSRYCVSLWVSANDVMTPIEAAMRERRKICKGPGVHCSMVVKGRVACDLGLGKQRRKIRRLM